MDNNISKEQEIKNKEELRRARLEQILSISGSEASFKNENNPVIIPNNEDVASALIFKTLKRDKLTESNLLDSLQGSKEALKNVLNTEISELKPNVEFLSSTGNGKDGTGDSGKEDSLITDTGREKPEYVMRHFYDDRLKEIEDLEQEISGLKVEKADLEAQVAGLKTDVENANYEKLATEQSNDSLANQVDSTMKTVDEMSGKVESSLQKAVEESILRASLQAQNQGYKAQIESLIKQIDSLNSLVEGLQSQLGAVQQQQTIQAAAKAAAGSSGGTIVNEVVVASAKPQGPPGGAPIIGRINNLTYEYRWEAGQQLFIVNNDLNAVNVKVEVFNPSGQNWLQCPITSFDLPAGDSKDIDFIFNVGGASFAANGYSQTHSGNIRVTVKRRDGSIASSNIETKLSIMNPTAY